MTEKFDHPDPGRDGGKSKGLERIVAQFCVQGDYVDAVAVKSGHIHDTYTVSVNQKGRRIRYILQRINHAVFKDPFSLMENILRVTQHLREKLSEGGPRSALSLVKATDGGVFYEDQEGHSWRVYHFIEGARTHDVIKNTNQAFQTAKAIGEFQKALLDLPGGDLHETIPDFHNTRKRVDDLLAAVKMDVCNRALTAKKEIECSMSRHNTVDVLFTLRKKGDLPERITHNDTKINNVMLDDQTGNGICVIDLDTVMPGLIHYDFGDLVRTGINFAAEDEKDLSRISLNLSLYEALLSGYLESAGEFLTKEEKEYLPFSGQLMAFETGIRFLTDYLSGDSYFKVQWEDHNLERCRTQFKLLECLEKQEDRLYTLMK